MKAAPRANSQARRASKISQHIPDPHFADQMRDVPMRMN